MPKQSNNPAPHAGEKEAPAIPKDGETPGMGAPPGFDEDKRQPARDRDPHTEATLPPGQGVDPKRNTMKRLERPEKNG